MANQTEYDLVVVGGGPAGYAAAIRAGQLGKKVVCIEGERAGGTCLNWGCIPSKALLKTAELFESIKHAEAFGLHCEGVSFDFKKVIERSRNVADQMAQGIEFLFKKNKVDYHVGLAQIHAPGMVEIIEGKEKGTYFKCENILVATGCRARTLPNIEVDGKRVMTSREALVMDSLPKSVTVLGAGAIGAEFAYFLNALGSEVTLVEMMDHVLPVEDTEVSKAVERDFKKQGIKIHTKTKCKNIQVGKNGVSMDLEKNQGDTKHQSETLLLAIGVTPNTDKLLGSRMELERERDYIKVDERYQTSIPGIYAAGDIIGAPWLAHVATYEAIQAVNGMFREDTPKRVSHYPSCTYCQPQVASIGLTEKAIKEKGLSYKTGKFPFSASGKAVASNHPEGFVKLIVSEDDEEILGAHIIGSEATEMIAEYSLGLSLEATPKEIHECIHAHPTLAEAMMEAAADVSSEAIHI